MKKLTMMLLSAACAVSATYARPYFNTSKDLLLMQYDSKPDPDDIHAQAAAGCMLAHADHAAVNYYAVQGAYGIQGGAFIESGTLFDMAFGVENTDWTDANSDWWGSVTRIKNKAKPILQNGGKVWVAEAGQSNITADWIAALIADGISEATIKANVVVVQHSQWNQDQTAPADLTYVQNKTDYYYIDDGNAPYGSTTWGDHGPYSTPQYNNASTVYLAEAKAASNPNAKAKQLWTEADRICDTQSYHPDWSNITPGGVDFSDTVEIWWILNVTDAGTNQDGFWDKYVTNTPQSSGSDTLDASQMPVTMVSATSYTVTVPYTTTENRDLYVELWQGSSWKMGKKVDLNLRSGTASVTLTGTAPAAGTGYFWKLYMTLDGQNWQYQVPNTYKQVNNVTVTSGGTPTVDSVDYTALPASVASATSYTVSVPYSATTSRDVVIEIWDTGWRGTKTTTVSAGTETIQVTVPVYNGVALTAGTGYIWKANIRPVGTDWTQNIAGGGGTKAFEVTGGSTGGGTVVETPTQDAYIQGTTVFNDSNLKVEPNYRVSYLKFDVDGIGGTVTEAKLILQLTEAGSGTVRVYQGNSNLTWTESTLTAATAPGTGTELGSKTGTFANGSVQEIDLGTSIGNGEITFVVKMDGGGNDIWASSSEGANSPRLEITYQ